MERVTGSVGNAESGGHPRRECPKFLARIGGKRGDVSALKGGGKKGYKGKGTVGKGYKGTWNGNGKGYQTYRYNYNQRYLGKAVGKKVSIH